MSRSVDLWVGKTHDTAVPPRVRLRVWEREGGRCWLSGRKIQPGEPWDLDHKVALINGGTHSEDNLAPALRDKHRAKTAEDVAEKAVIARQRSKHLGITKAKRPWPSRGFDGLPSKKTLRMQARAVSGEAEQVSVGISRSEMKHGRNQ